MCCIAVTNYTNIYTYRCINHNDTMKTSEDTSQKNIPLTLFERFVRERELETEQNCNILTSPLLWPSAFLFRSPGLLDRRPGGPTLRWVLAFSTASCHQLVWSPNSIRGPEGPFCWVLLFSTASSLQTLRSPN